MASYPERPVGLAGAACALTNGFVVEVRAALVRKLTDLSR